MSSTAFSFSFNLLVEGVIDKLSLNFPAIRKLILRMIVTKCICRPYLEFQSLDEIFKKLYDHDPWDATLDDSTKCSVIESVLLQTAQEACSNKEYIQLFENAYQLTREKVKVEHKLKREASIARWYSSDSTSEEACVSKRFRVTLPGEEGVIDLKASTEVSPSTEITATDISIASYSSVSYQRDQCSSAKSTSEIVCSDKELIVKKKVRFCV